tara:strand:+ start:809 stop:934 length:126 start_codon:yes stop_codon:yes gene_type:complete
MGLNMLGIRVIFVNPKKMLPETMASFVGVTGFEPVTSTLSR